MNRFNIFFTFNIYSEYFLQTDTVSYLCFSAVRQEAIDIRTDDKAFNCIQILYEIKYEFLSSSRQVGRLYLQKKVNLDFTVEDSLLSQICTIFKLSKSVKRTTFAHHDNNRTAFLNYFAFLNSTSFSIQFETSHGYSMNEPSRKASQMLSGAHFRYENKFLSFCPLNVAKI